MFIRSFSNDTEKAMQSNSESGRWFSIDRSSVCFADVPSYQKCQVKNLSQSMSLRSLMILYRVCTARFPIPTAYVFG